VPYQLEVSSPGMDRILRTPAHYQRHVGQRAHVELVAPREGRRRYTGELLRAAEDDFDLDVDGAVVTIRYAEVGKTRLAPDWSRQQRRGKRR
jgi:ribosome maturation factor RimP